MNKYIKTVKILILALVLSVGVSFASADWKSAPPSPPNDNVPAPINVGGISQLKAGPLITYWLGVINGGKLVFDNSTGERIQLYGASGASGNTAIGVQNSTLYFRTGPANNFAFYKGGTPSDGLTDPGAGGTKMMVLSSDSKAYVNDVCLFSNTSKCLSSAGTTVGGGTVTNTNGLLPVSTGVINKGESHSFGTDWKLIMLSDGFVMKDASGNVSWSLPNYATGNGQGYLTGSGSQTIGNFQSGNGLLINVSGGSVSITAGQSQPLPGSQGTAGTSLSYVVLK